MTGQRVGSYEIVRVLARGGMAVVYLARQPALERDVALKRVDLDSRDPTIAQRFVREAQLAGALAHPNIVTLYDFLEADGVPYIAMEYISGGSLRPFIASLTRAQVFGVLEGVLAGLDHAEGARGRAPRSQARERARDHARGAVKLADFGIARAYNSLTGRLTNTGIAVGTPTYMAPEQALNEDLSPSTDLYAIGVMAFEMLAGRPPFEASDTPMAVLFAHVNQPVPPLTGLAPDVPEELCRWVEWLLAKAPVRSPAVRRGGVGGARAARRRRARAVLAPAGADRGAERSVGHGLDDVRPRHAGGAPGARPIRGARSQSRPGAARPNRTAAGARPTPEPEPIPEPEPPAPQPTPAEPELPPADWSAPTLRAPERDARVRTDHRAPRRRRGDAGRRRRAGSPRRARPPQRGTGRRRRGRDRGGRGAAPAALAMTPRAHPRRQRPRPRARPPMTSTATVARSWSSASPMPARARSPCSSPDARTIDPAAAGLSDAGEVRQFGASLASGDFDGDGSADLAIGARDAGAVAVLYGSGDGLDTGRKQTFDDDVARYGSALAAGDLNDDGRDDLVIGAPGTGDSGGELQIRFGGTEGLGDAARSIAPPDGAAAGFGARARLGDVNADGSLDIVESGAANRSDEGHTTFCAGSDSGPRSCTSVNSDGGTALAVGDVDGDGAADVVQGDTGPDPAAVAGEVRVLKGGGDGPDPTPLVITQETAAVPGNDQDGDEFGSTVSVARVDGDRFEDIIVGAPGDIIEVPGDDEIGRVTVIRGGRDGIAPNGTRSFRPARRS